MNRQPSAVTTLLICAFLVAGIVTIVAFAVRASQDPVAIEASDPTDQLERAIAGQDPIERPDPSMLVREPLVSGAVAGVMGIVVGGALILVSSVNRR